MALWYGRICLDLRISVSLITSCPQAIRKMPSYIVQQQNHFPSAPNYATLLSNSEFLSDLLSFHLLDGALTLSMGHISDVWHYGHSKLNGAMSCMGGSATEWARVWLYSNCHYIYSHCNNLTPIAGCFTSDQVSLIATSTGQWWQLLLDQVILSATGAHSR